MNTPLNLRSAAELCGCSVSTIKRKKADLQAVGAICDKTGWQVMPEHLQKIGLLKGAHFEPPVSSHMNATEHAVNSPSNQEIEHLKELLELARADVVAANERAERYREDFERERARAEAAEKSRTELERSLVGAAVAFKELTAAPSHVVDASDASDHDVQGETQTKKLTWWTRLLRK